MVSPFAAAADLIDPPPNPHAHDPAGWIGARLGEQLWDAQHQICDALVDARKVAVQSCHDAGKSFIASRLIGWWLDTHPPGEAFVVSTAPTFHQVRGILWREVGKAHRKAEARGTPLQGRVLQTSEWKIGAELVGWGRKPADTDEHGFQGIHARYVLVVIDEACGVPDQLWTAVEAITTNADSRILAIGNPDDPTGRFAKVCRPESGWRTIRIDGMRTPNIGIDTLTAAATQEMDPPLTDVQLDALLDEARSAGCPEKAPGAGALGPFLLEPFWIADKVRTFGIGSPAWCSKVRGAFPDSADDTLIPLGWITQALDRSYELQPNDLRILPVDVARFGSDETIIGLREGDRFRMLIKDPGKRRTTATSGQAIALHGEHVTDEIRVDGAGVGGGVVDEIAEQGYPVIDMQAGQAAQDSRRFGNARAEWYWTLRMRFQDGDIDIDDEVMAGQLQALKYHFDKRGRIFVESKDKMRERGMPSPDRADTAMMAFADVVLPEEELYEEDHRVAISDY